jgi:Mg/Co/Ni transporter MgtE
LRSDDGALDCFAYHRCDFVGCQWRAEAAAFPCAERDVRGDDRMPEVRERVRAAGWDTCFVTDEHGVVLGRLGRAALAADDDVSVEEAMTLGPSTVRPSLELDAAVERMRAQSLTTLPVTRSDGVLIGVLRREDAEQALESLATA